MNTGFDSPSAFFINSLVFSGGDIRSEDELNLDAALDTVAPGQSNAPTDAARSSAEGQRVSTYVKIFEDMVSMVLKHDDKLLSMDELALLTIFAYLSYNARFLMVRLLLRKRDAWHRLDSLKYESELGSVNQIVEAIDELCQTGSDCKDDVKKEEEEEEEEEEREVIDLTREGSSIDIEEAQLQPPTVDVDCSKPSSERKSGTLAWCEQEMKLRDLLDCLKLEELKAIAKKFQLKTNLKKEDLIKELLRSSSSQLTLTHFARRDGNAQLKPKGCTHHARTRSGMLNSQQDRLRELAIHALGRCIRVDGEFFSVIYRVNLVYFRITQHTPGILVAALLSRFNKRSYATYECERTENIWPDREALLDYEKALILEGRIDAVLAGEVPTLADRTNGSITPAPRRLPTPVTPGTNGKREGGEFENEDAPDIKPDSNRVRGARVVREIFDSIYPRWLDLVKVKGEEQGREYGLERFHCGHVLTRIVCKGCNALAVLGEHERELDVLEVLLAQKRWRRGRRGMWYERRALILCTHLPKDEHNSQRALDGVIDALEDPDTHIVYRPKLQRRLKKLENKLKIPITDRHICEGALGDAKEVTFEATRLKHRAASVKLDRVGRPINDGTPQKGDQGIKQFYSPATALVKPESSSSAAPPSAPQALPDKQKGKSVWLGRNGEELTVEGLALQRYEDQGFKGVHCETRIISTLFGLLFWDVIFAPVPGAFETPYQTAPLDIGEDSFYISRMDLMEERLAAIKSGQAVEFLQEVDAKHRAQKTWCVGVQWDLFTYEDLVDIVKCIGGEALSAICRVLCEDYSAGQSGGPDLFLWNPEEGTCKFVEVKGPGDTLQENQRLWIDILLRAPVPVEVCRVVESGSETDKKPKRTPKTARKTPKKRVTRGTSPLKKKIDEEIVESEDEDDALPTINSKAQPDSMGPRAPPGRADHPPDGSSSVLPEDEEETSSRPLKRKLSRVEVVLPSPSKRPKQ